MSLLKIASWTVVCLSVSQYNELSGRELPDQQLVLTSSWVKDCAIQQMYPPLSASGHTLIAIWWMSIIYFTAARAVVAEVVQIINAWRASKPAGVKEISDINLRCITWLLYFWAPAVLSPLFHLNQVQSNLVELTVRIPKWCRPVSKKPELYLWPSVRATKCCCDMCPTFKNETSKSHGDLGSVNKCFWWTLFWITKI